MARAAAPLRQLAYRLHTDEPLVDEGQQLLGVRAFVEAEGLTRLGPQCPGPFLLMDRAYEGNETRQLALALGYMPVVPPLSTRVHPWVYDREMYKRRNEVERLFRRLKGFRRIFSRFEKLDVLFLGFISFALILDALR